jgi:nucleotide-binding universal stress UspA family protein
VTRVTALLLGVALVVEFALLAAAQAPADLTLTRLARDAGLGRTTVHADLRAGGPVPAWSWARSARRATPLVRDRRRPALPHPGDTRPGRGGRCRADRGAATTVVGGSRRATRTGTVQMDGNDSAPRVVVGVDGSASSYAALRWAVTQAGLIGGVVEAVAAWEPPMEYGWSAPVVDPSFDKDMARRRFTEELGRVLGDEPSVPVREQLVMGDPAEVLLDAARGAAVLVVGSRGHGRFTQALLGSVSMRCAQHAACPVVIVRPDGEDAPTG